MSQGGTVIQVGPLRRREFDSHKLQLLSFFFCIWIRERKVCIYHFVWLLGESVAFKMVVPFTLKNHISMACLNERKILFLLNQYKQEAKTLRDHISSESTNKNIHPDRITCTFTASHRNNS